jgi:hypothetical protein
MSASLRRRTAASAVALVLVFPATYWVAGTLTKWIGVLALGFVGDYAKTQGVRLGLVALATVSHLIALSWGWPTGKRWLLQASWQRVIASEAIIAVLSYMPLVAVVVFTRGSAPFASVRDIVMTCSGIWLLGGPVLSTLLVIRVAQSTSERAD